MMVAELITADEEGAGKRLEVMDLEKSVLVVVVVVVAAMSTIIQKPPGKHFFHLWNAIADAAAH